MSSNFNINTSLQMNGFNQNIDSFNKMFSNSLNSTNEAFDITNGAGMQGVNGIGMQGASEFEKVFNSLSPLEAGVSYSEGTRKTENTSPFSQIEGRNQKNMSPSAKLAFDIGQGLSDSLGELNTAQKKAEHDIETFASGGDISIHDVMISSRKSSLAMQMAIQLRNQVISAYNELRNMQV